MPLRPAAVDLRLGQLKACRWAILGAGREGQAMIRWAKTRSVEEGAGQALWVFSEQELNWPTDLPWDPQHDHLVIAPLAATELAQFDVLVKSPGISPLHPALSSLPATTLITSSTNLWFAERSGRKVLAISGTKGKSTTSALTAHLLRQAGRNVELVGNIGVPVLERLHQQPDWWVMELSSYQCADLHAEPEVGVILSLFPEHLDWHGSEHAYVQDKLRLLACARQAWVPQSLRADLARWLSTQPEVYARIQWLQQQHELYPSAAGVMQGNELLLATSELPLVGQHNTHNICVAWALARYAGLQDAEIRAGLASFQALPHRLQNLGEFAGRRYINDSISTTPHASLAALQACADQRVTLLLGGHDRGLPWQDFADALYQQPCHAVVTIGRQGQRIAELLAQRGVALAGGIHQAVDLTQAVQLARGCTPTQGLILLSPGAPSYGEFKNFEARGQRFAELAAQP